MSTTEATPLMICPDPSAHAVTTRAVPTQKHPAPVRGNPELVSALPVTHTSGFYQSHCLYGDLSAANCCCQHGHPHRTAVVASVVATTDVSPVKVQVHPQKKKVVVSFADDDNDDDSEETYEDDDLSSTATTTAATSSTRFWAGFLFVPMYMAFGILMKLQSHLRSHLFISSSTLADTYLSQGCNVSSMGGNLTNATATGDLLENGAASQPAYLFGLCVSFYYVGCFMFRIGHNVVFGGGGAKLWKSVQPATRVVIGYAGMSLALALIAIFFYAGLFNSTDRGFGWTSTPQAVHDHPKAVLLVSFCYWLAGCSIATFEPNLLSTLTAHGPKSKVRSIGAQPISTTTVAATALLGFGMAAHQVSTVSHLEFGVYVIGSLLCGFGILIFKYRIPTVRFEASGDDLSKFWSSLKRWREWIFEIKWLFVAGFVDQIALALALGIGQYIYSVDRVPLLLPFVTLSSPQQVFVQHDFFLAIFFSCACIGGTLSRLNVYRFNLQNPMLFLMSSVIGIILILKTPLLALIGVFCITYANGSVYATTARTIDETVPWEFNLVAYSLVACVADVGGFTGANIVVPIHASLGSVGHGGPF